MKYSHFSISKQSRPLTGILVCLVLYVAGVLIYATWENFDLKKHLYKGIDEKLLLAAKSLKYTLADDFHDRAVDESSITFEEELKNRLAINRLASETEFKWLYTLVEKGGKFYFSAPTVSEQEAKERKRWYFLAYDDIPSEFVTAFKKKHAVFVEYTDQWGTFRSVVLPQLSPGGRLYLACVDHDITYVRSLLVRNLWKSILTSLFFFLIVTPFLFLFRIYAAQLKCQNKELTENRSSLEMRVDERTAELTIAKDKADQLVEDLKLALKEVKTLSGLIPICANCKQVRDDKGYWHQVEEYIKFHSEVKITHGICPDCAVKLYPELKKELEMQGCLT